jgi:hypothetical protein
LLRTFLKKVDPALFREYNLEVFVSNRGPTQEDTMKKGAYTSIPVFKEKPKETQEKRQENSVLGSIPTISSLDDEHPAKKYLLDRKIPSQWLDRIRFAEDFRKFVLELLPSYDKKLATSDPRIVIPYYDKEKNLIGIQARSLKGDVYNKYITVKISENFDKVFGLDLVDLSKRVYVVEGPIDSMFIPNCVATMDSALYNIVHVLGESVDYVFVYDNQPRNPHVVEFMKKTIRMGCNVVIWPNDESKDINDLVISGMAPQEVLGVIDNNTFSGLKASLMLSMWQNGLN